MNFKTTYIMFVTLIVLLTIFGLWQFFGSKPGTENLVMASMNKAKIKNDDIDGVVIERSRPRAEKLVFVRSGEGDDKRWRLIEPFEDRVEKYQIEDLIRQVIDARKEENADIDSNLKKWGLDSPAVVVTLQKGADKKWTFNVGNESPGSAANALVYVAAGDKPNQPAAVKRPDLAGLFKSVNEFRPKTLLAESSFDITSVKLQEPKHELVSIDKTSEGRWRFEKPAFGEADYEGEGTPPFQGATPPPETKITGVRDLLDAVQNIRVESDADFADTNVKDADLAAKGLTDASPERMRIEIKKQAATGAEGKKEEAPAHVLLIGKKADDKGEKLYARLADSKNLVKISAKNVDKLSKVVENPAALRNRELVQIDASKTNTIDAIDVKLSSGELFKLRRAAEAAAATPGMTGNWKIFESGKAQEAEFSAVQGLINALTAKRLVKDFPDAAKSDAELGLDKPAAVVSLWVEGIKKEEPKDEKKDEKDKDAKKDEKKDAKAETKKDAKVEEKKDSKAAETKKDEKKDAKADEKKDRKDADAKKEEKKDPNAEPKLKDEKPTVKLTFGKTDKDVVYVKRESGGEVVRLAVPANVLEKAGEGKLAYVVRRLPSYGFSNEVTKVLLTRGGETFEIDRAKDDKSFSSWKLKQPKEYAGRTADSLKIERILNELRDLQPEKLVAEKATPGDMDRFGLSIPQQKVTLTLTRSDKKTEDHTYLFGKESPDKAGVYAQKSGNDLVFEVRKTAVEALQGDLLDPTVFTLDPAKVRKLRLTGWQDIIGSPYTLDLEREAGKIWAAKAPPGYTLDVAKVDSFVGGLSNLRAVRYLPPKSPPKPEYKLDLKDGALEIFLTVEGEKQEFTLTIGGPAGNEGFYATSNKVPADVFILPKPAFEQAKSKPAHFKKE